MTIKLLCIDPLEDYELVDRDLLNSFGIEAIFLCKTSAKVALFKNSFLVNSFDYEDLHAICKLIRPEYIVCFTESLFVDLAKIRKELEICGMNLSTAMLLSYKNVMYEKLCGIVQYPETTVITKDVTLDSLKTILGSKEIFIKPINKAGSYETYLVKDNGDYGNFILTQKEGLENYIAQTYINAELYHSELVIFNGEILFSSARKYTLPNYLTVSLNAPLFSINIENENQYQVILNASIKVKEVLGVNDGILHTEFFLSQDGDLNFIETNARPPGLGLNRMYRKRLAISLETILCFIVCNVKPPNVVEDANNYICGYYPLRSGTIKNIKMPKLDVANEWIVYVELNDSIEQAQHLTKAAMVICWDKCIKKIKDAGNVLSNHNVIELY